MKIILLLCFASILLPATGLAQDDTETSAFLCPLQNASIHIDSASIKMYGTAEKKLIINSKTDTLIKAPADIQIFTVQRDTDGTYEIVFSHSDYYFWLSGVHKTLVRAGQRLPKGEAVGILATGTKLEILLFEDETPVEPTDYLPCLLAKP
ncbi:MAG: hypothetical protein ACK4E0_11440 [Chitinophagaceae bacterium]